MIGRDRELETSHQDLGACRGRRPSALRDGVRSAGIGKSRIALELAELVGPQGGRVIRGRSTPYGAATPYSAFAQQVKQIASIFDSDDETEARRS